MEIGAAEALNDGAARDVIEAAAPAGAEPMDAAALKRMTSTGAAKDGAANSAARRTARVLRIIELRIDETTATVRGPKTYDHLGLSATRRSTNSPCNDYSFLIFPPALEVNQKKHCWENDFS
jgi:hypothetical protein